ncbi:MAG: methyltransferase domain-containing protein, partial [Spirochaetes bacterium]|nr:methyltransferase domain-containing protein [Spirochaetota bacterium]
KKKYKEIVYSKEIKLLKEWENNFLKDIKKFLVFYGYLKEEESIKKLSDLWPDFSKKELNGKPPTKEFYKKWNGLLGAINIAANAQDQFKRPYILRALKKHVSKDFEGKILDYGCGTASISLSYQKKYAPKSQLILADVNNLAKEFIKNYIKNNPQLNIKIQNIYLSEILDNSIDVILCIDVLEHLKNPSEVFFLLDKKLKRGGILILKAPWRGHPEHLEESPIDWKNNNGQKYIKSKYLILKRFNPFVSPSGVYMKK